MTNLTSDRLKELVAVAEDLPERYREVAFKELMRFELETSTHQPDATGGQLPSRDSASEATQPDQPNWFNGLLQAMPNLDCFATANRDSQVAWALVELKRRREAGTTAAIRSIIKDELGITPEDSANLSSRLGRGFTPAFATRQKHGKGYVYEPTRRIAEKFPKGCDD